jgi:hypothetical protein
LEDCGVSDDSPKAQKWDGPKSARATLDTHRKGGGDVGRTRCKVVAHDVEHQCSWEDWRWGSRVRLQGKPTFSTP